MVAESSSEMATDKAFPQTTYWEKNNIGFKWVTYFFLVFSKMIEFDNFFWV